MNQVGSLAVEEAGHKYFIEVRIPKEAVCEDNEEAWVRAQTVREQRRAAGTCNS